MSIEENKETGALDGKWKNSAFAVVIKGNTYKSFYNGYRYGKGKIEYENGSFTLTSTHARKFLFWTSFVEIVKGTYIASIDEVIISNIEGRYSDFNGNWRKIK